MLSLPTKVFERNCLLFYLVAASWKLLYADSITNNILNFLPYDSSGALTSKVNLNDSKRSKLIITIIITTIL